MLLKNVYLQLLFVSVLVQAKNVSWVWNKDRASLLNTSVNAVIINLLSVKGRK